MITAWPYFKQAAGLDRQGTNSSSKQTCPATAPHPHQWCLACAVPQGRRRARRQQAFNRACMPCLTGSKHSGGAAAVTRIQLCAQAQQRREL